MAPSDPSGTVLEVCLRVRQSGAIRVLVALVRMILDLWAAPPRCGYWGSLGFFCSAPQDFGMLGVFCARFPPREASYFSGAQGAGRAVFSSFLEALGSPPNLDAEPPRAAEPFLL